MPDDFFSPKLSFLGFDKLNYDFLPSDTKLFPSLKLLLRYFLFFTFIIFYEFSNCLLPLIFYRISKNSADGSDVFNLAHKLLVCDNVVRHWLIKRIINWVISKRRKTSIIEYVKSWFISLHFLQVALLKFWSGEISDCSS